MSYEFKNGSNHDCSEFIDSQYKVERESWNVIKYRNLFIIISIDDKLIELLFYPQSYDEGEGKQKKMNSIERAKKIEINGNKSMMKLWPYVR